jgi:hypothetical protein
MIWKNKEFNMKKIISLSLILSFMLLSGCLWYEVVEYTIHFNENLNSGRITVRYSNIQSTEQDTAKIRAEFTDLLNMVTGDDFLLDGLESGIYIQERRLAEENGQLVAYEQGIFRKLALDDEQSTIQNDERIITMSNDDKEKIECNGKMIKLEKNTILTWPKEQRDLYIKVTSAPHDSLSSMLAHYREWKRSGGK